VITRRYTLSSLLLLAATAAAQSPGAPPPKLPVATVAGQAIYDEDLVSSIQAQVLALRKQEYEVKKRALDTLIDEKVLEAAAKKKELTTEKLLQQEVDAKVPEPAEAELQGFYLGQKDRWNRPFDEIKDQLRQSAKQVKIQQARQDYLKALRASGDVVIQLAPPKVQVGHDPARLRGNPKAPVTIVEFSDFQCPYCRQVASTLKEVLAKYGEKVNLAYRDYPLPSIHPQAELAAEASRCAGEQGKFWEYHDQLFNTSNLSRSALMDDARILKLDDQQFDACLASGKYKVEVQRDEEEGTRAGVSGTPGFFINGVFIGGSQPLGAFVRAIDEELARER